MGNSRERFARLAEARTKKAIKTIRLIGNLSNRTNYTYTETEIEKIFRALSSELKAARKRFSQQSGSGGVVDFSL